MSRAPLDDADDDAIGEQIGRAVRQEGPRGLETRRVRAVARARLFGDEVPDTRVDRYFLLELLGRGGMGSVHAAYDPKLGRKVALKVLDGPRPADPAATTGASATDGADRLVAEARALARVRHPNVVQVFDAGSHGDQVYLTMELVEGETLRAWMNCHPQAAWREVLAPFLACGRGLAAVHAAGLVHRDFKPENVLMGTDGVVRVADFGVARAERSPLPPVVGITQSLGDGRTTPDAGTPAYLAPERTAGQPADPRSDLYSYCVALHEALVGRRPTEPPLSMPPSLPTFLTRAVTRGLAVDPEARFPSMDALLRELEAGLAADTARTRRRSWVSRLGIGTSVAAVAVGGIAGARELRLRGAAAACDAAGSEIETLWPGRAPAVQAGLLGTGQAYAATTSERLTSWLDAWAQTWRDVRVTACREHGLDETLPAQAHARVEGCLAVGRAEVADWLAVLETGDAEAMRRAVSSAAGLPRPEACADPARVRAGTWPDQAQWDLVLTQERRLGAAAALQRAGRFDEAEAEVEAIVEDAGTLGFAPLVARAQLRLGTILEQRGEWERAASTLQSAYFAAARAGADEVAADAALELVWTVGHRLARRDQGELWADHASMWLERRGTAPDERQATLLHRIASLREQAGDLEGARVAAEEALALRARAQLPRPPVETSHGRG